MTTALLPCLAGSVLLQVVGTVLLVVFQLLIVVVMLNLLLAIVYEIYEVVQSQQELHKLQHTAALLLELHGQEEQQQRKEAKAEADAPNDQQGGISLQHVYQANHAEQQEAVLMAVQQEASGQVSVQFDAIDSIFASAESKSSALSSNTSRRQRVVPSVEDRYLHVIMRPQPRVGNATDGTAKQLETLRAEVVALHEHNTAVLAHLQQLQALLHVAGGCC